MCTAIGKFANSQLDAFDTHSLTWLACDGGRSSCFRLRTPTCCIQLSCLTSYMIGLEDDSIEMHTRRVTTSPTKCTGNGSATGV